MYRTLIISPNWIGDAVMSLPLITELYHQGHHHIHVLAPNIVAPIYENCNFINKVINHNLPHKKILFKQRLIRAKELNKNNYTHIYILPNSLKSMILPIFMRAKYKIAYKGEWPRKYFLTHSTENQGKKLPMVHHYYQLSTINKIQSLPKNLYPKLDISQNLKKECLNKFNLNTEYLCIAIGAEYGPAKQWPLQHFQKLIFLIEKEYPALKIVLLGSNKDYTNAQSLINPQSTNVYNLCGITSLNEAILIIAGASKILTHDSGLMHIAAAVKTPVLAIYGSTSPLYTPPLADNAQYIWLNLECSPCFKRTCQFKHYNCLQHIHPQQVFEKLFQS